MPRNEWWRATPERRNIERIPSERIYRHREGVREVLEHQNRVLEGKNPVRPRDQISSRTTYRFPRRTGVQIRNPRPSVVITKTPGRESGIKSASRYLAKKAGSIAGKSVLRTVGGFVVKRLLGPASLAVELYPIAKEGAGALMAGAHARKHAKAAERFIRNRKMGTSN